MLKFQVRNNVSFRVNSFFLSHRFPVISFFFFFPQTCIKEKSISLCNIFFFYSRLHNLTTGLTFKYIWDTEIYNIENEIQHMAIFLLKNWSTS